MNVRSRLSKVDCAPVVSELVVLIKKLLAGGTSGLAENPMVREAERYAGRTQESRRRQKLEAEIVEAESRGRARGAWLGM